MCVKIKFICISVGCKMSQTLLSIAVGQETFVMQNLFSFIQNLLVRFPSIFFLNNSKNKFREQLFLTNHPRFCARKTNFLKKKPKRKLNNETFYVTTA